ncbi:MAG: hypothetical protein ACK4FB_10125 [Brevundimonas sp.]|uniref:hypothetical protein n=1 Tax=Brevundimonas sp. TaxID=1871086 RepID=UPI003919D078
MIEPPRWLPWLGPPLAGLAVLAAYALMPRADLWQLVLIGLLVGFLPYLVVRIWRWRAGRH